jgi:hypothetical protein
MVGQRLATSLGIFAALEPASLARNEVNASLLGARIVMLDALLSALTIAGCPSNRPERC